MRVVNLFAGPGTGKSTVAADLFAELKWRGVNCEYVQEGAKDAAWEGRSAKYWSCQPYVSSEQIWRQHRLQGDCDLAVTDSPIVQGLVYTWDKNEAAWNAMRDLLLTQFGKYDNLNVFLRRCKPYNPKGRNQTEEEAHLLDNSIKSMLVFYRISYVEIDASRDAKYTLIDMMNDKGWNIPKE